MRRRQLSSIAEVGSGSSVGKSSLQDRLQVSDVNSSVGGKPAVFISYPTEDRAVASKLEDAIKSLEGNQFDVFLDQTYIEGGRQISQTIRSGLDKTVYFVGIGTFAARNNFSWCGLELGYFTALNRDGSGLVTCLYHDEIPDVFQPYKCFRVVALNETQTTELGKKVFEVHKAPLFEFLTEIANEHNRRFKSRNEASFFASAGEWAKKWALEITDAYFSALQNRVKEKWYPQGRLEVTVADGLFFQKTPQEIPANATIHIEATTYSILNLGMPAGLSRVSIS
jgi:hypothetical protein